MTIDLVYVGAHDEAIRRGARLREVGREYGVSESLERLLESYLAGDDEALEFTTVKPDDLERLAN
jgi:hypothetical protein